MTVKRIVTPNEWTGASGDDKPTQATDARVRVGDTFYEHDTDLMYITYDGTTWVTKASADTLGAVTITALVPGVAATNLGKAEDAAHASGDTGVAVLGIRDDTLSVFSGAENDYEPFHMTAAGRLYTSAVVDTALPTGANAIGKLAANTGVDIGDVDVASIAAGTNLIGKVGIDQVTANANEVVVKSITTGDTNIGNVDLASAIPAGTNLMGKVGIDQATANANEVVIKSGTVTAVTGITNALPAGTNNIGDVDVASIAAGTARVGTVSGVCKTVSVTKACAAAVDYTAEDVLSEHATEGTAWTFAAIFRANNTGGYITKALVSCETTALTPRLTLYLYNAAPSCVLNDNVANTGVLNADIAQYVGKIDFPALGDLGGNSEAIATPSTYGNLPMWVDAAADADDLIGVLVTRDAITGEVDTDDYTIKLTVEQY